MCFFKGTVKIDVLDMFSEIGGHTQCKGRRLQKHVAEGDAGKWSSFGIQEQYLQVDKDEEERDQPLRLLLPEMPDTLGQKDPQVAELHVQRIEHQFG